MGRGVVVHEKILISKCGVLKPVTIKNIKAQIAVNILGPVRVHFMFNYFCSAKCDSFMYTNDERPGRVVSVIASELWGHVFDSQPCK